MTNGSALFLPITAMRKGMMCAGMVAGVAVMSAGISGARAAETPSPPATARQEAAAVAERRPSNPVAEAILKNSGIRAGVCVHVGCADGALTAGLMGQGTFVVHGLDRDDARIEGARKNIQSLGVYGRVSVGRHELAKLPYADNLINLLVVHDAADALKGGLDLKEVFRVLTPNGVAFIGQAEGTAGAFSEGDWEKQLAGAGFVDVAVVREKGTWCKAKKPRPAEMDDWPQRRHGADQHALSQDTALKPLCQLRWTAGQQIAEIRGSGGILGLFSANGRVFCVQREGEKDFLTPSPKAGQRWSIVLYARDAYNGTLLWKRPCASGSSLAAGEHVYVPLVDGGPLVALDAATGEIVRTYEELKSSVLYENGVLVGVTGGEIKAVEASSGGRRWAYAVERVSDVVIGDGRVFFLTYAKKQDPPFEYGCLDLKTGRELWKKNLSEWKWPSERRPKDLKELWLVCHQAGALAFSVVPVLHPWPPSGPQQPGTLFMVSAEDGAYRWNYKYTSRDHGGNPRNTYFTDGLWWVDGMKSVNEAGEYVDFQGLRGLDPQTGQVKKSWPLKIPLQRCHPNVATARYYFHNSMCMADFQTGKVHAWETIRGPCGSGYIVANGLVYTPPTGCTCGSRDWLPGFNASAGPDGSGPLDEEAPLEKGPAFGKVSATEETAEAAWPTYRHDPARSGSAPAEVPTDLGPLWTVTVGTGLTAPTVAEGKVFAAASEEHRVCAMDAQTGKLLWSRTVGGRVDSPPTIYRGACLFGSRDGWVTCLRAVDGELVWRMRAAPGDQLIADRERLESSWPVHGTVLVDGGTAYFTAGRDTILKGGLNVHAVDPLTGALRWKRRVELNEKGREPWFGNNSQSSAVLAADGKYLLFANKNGWLDCAKGEPPPPNNKNASPSGIRTDIRVDLLDSAEAMNQASGSWWSYGGATGRMLVFNDHTILGFRIWTEGLEGKRDIRMRGELGKGHFWLFAQARNQGAAATVNGVPVPLWQSKIPVSITALVLAGSTLFVGGDPDAVDAKGGLLHAYKAADGSKLGEVKLDAPVRWDGMAAAYGRLYVATTDGKLSCFGARQDSVR